MKLAVIFNNWLRWGNCRGKSPSICTYQKTGGGTQKKAYEWAICKIPWPTSCRQRASNQWLKSSTLKRSTESTVAAIQEQAISTRHIKKHVFSIEDDDTCRICRVEKETTHHIISGCDGLSPTKYHERYDNVCKYIHVLLLLEHGFIEKYIPWYQH